MVACACSWLLMTAYKTFLAAYGCLWLPMFVYGCACLLMAACGCLCLLMPACACLWLVMVAYACPWLLMATCGCPCLLMSLMPAYVANVNLNLPMSAHACSWPPIPAYGCLMALCLHAAAYALWLLTPACGWLWPHGAADGCLSLLMAA